MNTLEMLAKKEESSLRWLRNNYAHIWLNDYMTVDAKAGFLAACCDTRRCFLATYSLVDRLSVIESALTDPDFGVEQLVVEEEEEE